MFRRDGRRNWLQASGQTHPHLNLTPAERTNATNNPDDFTESIEVGWGYATVFPTMEHGLPNGMPDIVGIVNEYGPLEASIRRYIPTNQQNGFTNIAF